MNEMLATLRDFRQWLQDEKKAIGENLRFLERFLSWLARLYPGESVLKPLAIIAFWIVAIYVSVLYIGQ